ncbi:MAG TPA: hypothetical protein VFF11_00575, partial [Candidatus Binatia bacterium]|nr:hypothetical protein [Candidatus Binatia bacterium]
MAVQQFSGATTEFATLTRSEFIQSREDVIEMNRLRVLLGDESAAKALEGHFTMERLQPRLRALDALNQYGELLQTLLTTSSSADLQSSADHFVSSLNQVQGIHISDADGKVFSRAVAFGGSFLVEYRRAKAMKRAVEFAHPYVVKTIDLVENDFDPDNDLWNAGYRHTQLDLEGAILDVPPLATNDLAGAQVVRTAKLAVQQNKARFAAVSQQILGAAKELSRAEGDLRMAMANGDVSVVDIQAFRGKVDEL